MAQATSNLGVCLSDKNLFYAISRPSNKKSLTYLGAVDFNFDVLQALVTRDGDHFPTVLETVRSLKEKFNVDRIRIQTCPAYECWSTLPKLIYDKADEREAYLNILMRGVDRRYIEPLWFELSNQNFKLLLVRNKNVMEGFKKLTNMVGQGAFYSEFELGHRWMQLTGQRGSFMTVSIQQNLVSIASFLLGKLRAATYIKFDDMKDLPYLWLQQAQHLKWLNGLHEYIYIYGNKTDQLIDMLAPHWDDAAEIQLLDSLHKIGVEAPERTYNFSITKAFPAILMAVPTT